MYVTCGCTESRLTPKDLEPGETGTLELTIKVDPGVDRSVLARLFDDPKSIHPLAEVKVFFKALRTMDPEIRPRSIKLDSWNIGKRVESELELRNLVKFEGELSYQVITPAGWTAQIFEPKYSRVSTMDLLLETRTLRIEGPTLFELGLTSFESDALEIIVLSGEAPVGLTQVPISITASNGVRPSMAKVLLPNSDTVVVLLRPEEEGASLPIVKHITPGCDWLHVEVVEAKSLIELRLSGVVAPEIQSRVLSTELMIEFMDYPALPLVIPVTLSRH